MFMEINVVLQTRGKEPARRVTNGWRGVNEGNTDALGLAS
jgi:hypothetical protein